MKAWLPASLRQYTRSIPPIRPVSSRHFASTSQHGAAGNITRQQPPPRDVFDAAIHEDVENRPPIQSAAEILFTKKGINAGPEGEEDGYIQGTPDIRARIVPISPSYFTGSPIFTDNLLHLRTVLRKYSTLPTVKPGEQPRIAWRDVVEYRNMCGEAVPNAKYHKVLSLLQRLNLINPALMPQEVKEALKPFQKAIDPSAGGAKPIPIDRFGRALGVGRRKASNARAWVVEGTGEVLINGKPLTQAFARIHDRESVLWALKATGRIDKYNVWALVEGGGTTGQAEALTLAVAKALLTHEPLLKPALRRAGVVTRDPRRVERKKAGRVKARKMPQWVKR